MKLEPHETAPSESTYPPSCAAPRCRHDCVRSGNGYELPFCRRHLERLTRALFDELVAIAGESVFDVGAASDAARVVAKALAHLKKGNRKR